MRQTVLVREWAVSPAPESALDLTGQARVADLNSRDELARVLLGTVLAKTPGSLQAAGWSDLAAGWLYVASNAVAFIADEPVFDRGRGGTNGERVAWLPVQDPSSLECRVGRWSAYGSLRFGDGTEVSGRRNALLCLANQGTPAAAPVAAPVAASSIGSAIGVPAGVAG
jgi:hypothetical protein